MALNIKNVETEKLAADVAEMAGESKTGAVTKALEERRDRLRLRSGASGKRPWRDMREYLETEIWPQIPAELRDKPPMTKAEVEEILGFGPEGY
jgi:antitoxin VapB